MPVTVKIHVPPDLLRALDGDMRKVIQKASEPLAAELMRTMMEPAPASEANKERPFTSKGNNRWYQRGFGPRWARKDGSVGGSKTSRQLDQSWSIARKGWGAIVGSGVPYAPAVQHYKEQAWFHKARGWVTDKMAVDKLLASGKVDRAVKAAVAWVMKGRG